MRSRVLPLALLLLSLTACEGTFELNGDGGGRDAIFLRCYPGLSDTTYLELHRAVPVGSKATDSLTLTDLSFRVDGSEVELEELGGNYFRTAAAFPAGATVEVEAKARGLEKASARSRVPQAFSFTTKPTRIRNSFVNILRFDLEIDKEVSDNDYFAVFFRSKVHTETDDGNPPADFVWSEGIASIGAFNSESDIFSYLSGSSFRTQEISFKRGDAVIAYNLSYFTGELFDGNTVSIYVSPSYSDTTYSYNPILYYNDEGEAVEGDSVNVVQTVNYQATLVQLSSEMFAHLNAEFNKEYNFLAELGLSAPNYSYTNVGGGYGILATALPVDGENIPFAEIE